MTVEQDYDPESDEDEWDDEIDDLVIEHRTSLKAAIVWIMTRNAELVYGLAENSCTNIDEIIHEADLTPVMPQEKAWAQLQATVSGGKVAMWGYEFKLPDDFEFESGWWPRGPGRQLASKDISNVCLFGVEGMALRPPGIIIPGQVWYCRVLVRTKELELAFPVLGNEPETRLSRGHKSQAAKEVYDRFFQTEDGWKNIKADMQLYRINEELKTAGFPTIEMRTLTKIRNN